MSDSSESFNVTHTENAIAASRMRLLLVHSFLSILGLVRGSVTVYGVQQPLGTGTATAASASYTGSGIYNQVVLTPPPVPNPPPPTSFAVQLQTGGAASGLSIPQSGAFFGFSIEFSVATQVRKYHWQAWWSGSFAET